MDVQDKAVYKMGLGMGIPTNFALMVEFPDVVVQDKAVYKMGLGMGIPTTFVLMVENSQIPSRGYTG